MSSLLQEGLNLTAIGMGVVFVLLTLLVGIIRAMSAVSRKIEGAMPAGPQAGAAEPATASQEELVIAISAAIAAYRKHH